MIAIREIIDVMNNTISINLPLDFPKGKVEVIVMPIKEKRKKNNAKPELPELINISKKDYASKIILEDRL